MQTVSCRATVNHPIVFGGQKSHWVGIARLKGRTLQHRAEDLISIAHPDFRPVLIEEYERRFRCKYLKN